MLTVKNSPVFGTQTGNGLIVPGAPAFGGGGSAPPDYSPIDLTSTTLDSRLMYQCASQHAYIDSSGLLQYANANEYPLEFDAVSLLPIGRSEPEAAATNLDPGGNAAPFLVTGPGNQRLDAGTETYGAHTTYRYTWNTTPTGNNFNLSQYPASVTEPGAYQYTVALKIIQSDISYSAATIAALLDVFWQGSGTLTKNSNRVIKKLSNGYYLCSMGFTTTGTGSAYLRVYVPQFSSFTAAFIFEAGPIQLEKADKSSSPIKTSGTPVTRSQADLSIKTQGANGCVLHFSDSTTSAVTFSAGEWFALPQAINDWGARAIQEITYTT